MAYGDSMRLSMMSGNEIQLRCASSKEWDSSLVTNKHQQKLGQHWDWETLELVDPWSSSSLHRIHSLDHISLFVRPNIHFCCSDIIFCWLSCPSIHVEFNCSFLSEDWAKSVALSCPIKHYHLGVYSIFKQTQNLFCWSQLQDMLKSLHISQDIPIDISKYMLKSLTIHSSLNPHQMLANLHFWSLLITIPHHYYPMNFHEYPMKNIHSFDLDFPVMFQWCSQKSWRFIAMKSHFLWWNPMRITNICWWISHHLPIHHEIPRHSIFQQHPNPPMFQSSNQSNSPAKSGDIARFFPKKSQHFPQASALPTWIWTKISWAEASPGLHLLCRTGWRWGFSISGNKLQGVHEGFMGIYWDF